MAQRSLKIIIVSAVLIAASLLALNLVLRMAERAQFSVLVIGDSITLGEMDQNVTKIQHADFNEPLRFGFIPRLKAALPEISISALGFEGKNSLRATELTFQEVLKNPFLAAQIENAELVIFAAGINDFWDVIAPRTGARRVRASVVKLKTIAPRASIFATAISIPEHPLHKRWALEFNRILLSKSLKNLTVGPRFDALLETELSSDKLHPNTAGYDHLAIILQNFICQEVLLRDKKDNFKIPQACIP